MSTPSLTADLLARKGTAQPTRKWADGSLLFHPGFSGATGARSNRQSGKTTAKTLRLDDQMNRHLRLLAARMNVSQQTIMEEALRRYLQASLENMECICGAEE